MIYLGSNEIAAIKLGNTDISAIYAGDLLIYPTDFGNLTAITIEDLVWETDVPSSGGTATSANCSFEVYALFDSGKRKNITSTATIAGSLEVSATTTPTRESVGTLTLTASYSGFTDTDSVTAYQEAANSYYTQYLTIRITGAGKLKWYSQSTSSRKTISYSKNNGISWTNVTAATGSSGTTISVSVGDVIIFKGTNNNYSNNTSSANSCFRNSTARFTVEGNIMSLIYGDNFVGNDEFPANSGSFHLCRMFQNCSGLTDASNLVLPAKTLYEGDYRSLFDTDKALTGKAPELPATTLGVQCYNNMFLYCAITTAPALPATSIPTSAYNSMFYSCTALTIAPELPALNLSPYCYSNMFRGSHITSIVLPATTIPSNGYNSMFRDSKITHIKCLATNISASNCTTNWLAGAPSSGTFIKVAGITWPTGTNGIPSGWTVVNNT